MKKSVSLSESDLEFLEIFNVFEEEKYFCVEWSLELIVVFDCGIKGFGVVKWCKDREEELNFGEFEEIMLGLFFMWYIRERIGWKLYEVD